MDLFFHVAAALSWYVPTPVTTKGNNTFVRIPQQPRSHTAQICKVPGREGRWARGKNNYNGRDDARSTVYIGSKVPLRAWIIKGRTMRRGNEILRVTYGGRK